MKMKSRIHKFHSWKYTPSEYLIGPPGGLYKDVIFKLFVVAGRQKQSWCLPRRWLKKTIVSAQSGVLWRSFKKCIKSIHNIMDRSLNRGLRERDLVLEWAI